MNYECRSAVGVLIGCVNVLGFSATSIYIIIILCDFGKLNDEDYKKNKDVISKTVTLLYIILVFCIIAIILSSLLLAGIIKKRHTLMIPWLICAAAGIVCHIIRLIVSFFSGLQSQTPDGDVFLTLIKNLIALGIQLLLFDVIRKLYKNIRDIRNETQTATEYEGTVLNTINDNPPSYQDLERNN